MRPKKIALSDSTGRHESIPSGKDVFNLRDSLKAATNLHEFKTVREKFEQDLKVATDRLVQSKQPLTKEEQAKKTQLGLRLRQLQNKLCKTDKIGLAKLTRCLVEKVGCSSKKEGQQDQQSGALQQEFADCLDEYSTKYDRECIEAEYLRLANQQTEATLMIRAVDHMDRESQDLQQKFAALPKSKDNIDDRAFTVVQDFSSTLERFNKSLQGQGPYLPSGVRADILNQVEKLKKEFSDSALLKEIQKTDAFREQIIGWQSRVKQLYATKIFNPTYFAETAGLIKEGEKLLSVSDLNPDLATFFNSKKDELKETKNTLMSLADLNESYNKADFLLALNKIRALSYDTKAALRDYWDKKFADAQAKKKESEKKVEMSVKDQTVLRDQTDRQVNAAKTESPDYDQEVLKLVERLRESRSANYGEGKDGTPTLQGVTREMKTAYLNLYAGQHSADDIAELDSEIAEKILANRKK